MDNKPKQTPMQSMSEALKPPNNTRMQANRLVGQAVHSSKVGDMVQGNPPSTNIGSGTSNGIQTIPDATSISVLNTLTDTFGRVLMAIPDIAIYTDKTTAGTPTISQADAWPNATYGAGNMPVTSFNDWGLTNNVNVVNRTVIRNNTGSQRAVIVIIRWRIITNASVALGGLGSGSAAQ